MIAFARICILAMLALAMEQLALPSAMAQCCGPICGPACRVPLTKSYRIEPGYCPAQLVQMIINCVPPSGEPPCCAPFGIPPVYTAGNFVMVRETPEVHERVGKYLAELGAYIPPKPLP